MHLTARLEDFACIAMDHVRRHLDSVNWATRLGYASVLTVVLAFPFAAESQWIGVGVVVLTVVFVGLAYFLVERAGQPSPATAQARPWSRAVMAVVLGCGAVGGCVLGAWLAGGSLLYGLAFGVAFACLIGVCVRMSLRESDGDVP